MGSGRVQSVTVDDPRPTTRRYRALGALCILGLAALVLGAPGPQPASANTHRVASASLLDDPAFNASLEEGLELLYNLDLTAAERHFRRLAQRHPGHPVGPLLTILGDWWRILLDPEDTSRDTRVLAALEETLRRAEARQARDRRDLDGRFLQATALALRARLRSLRGEWIPAAYDGRRALALIRALHEERPDNYDLYLGLGLYDYFAEALPERHAIFRPLRAFFPRGDKDRGLRHLRLASRLGRLSRVEAGYFLVQIHYHFEADYDRSLYHVRWLRQRYPGNALFHTLEGRVQARWGRCWEGGPILEEVLRRHYGGLEGYTASQAEQALYYLSHCDMRHRRYDAALARLDELERIAGPRGSSFRSLVHLRRGMAFDAQGQRTAAVAQYRRTLQLPDSASAHERARQFLRQPYTG
jgi:hypothetical protein